MHTSGEVEEGPARKGVVRVKETTNDVQLGGNRLGGGSCYLLWAWRGRKRRATETRGAQTTCGPWGASTS